MVYRKLKGSNIFDGYALRGENMVLILDESAAVVEIVPKENAGDGVETFEGILCPGFVNAHCHIELSHLKGKIPKHTGLVNFVQSVMTERTAQETEKQTAMQAAVEELYESGTIAVGDICNTADSLLIKQNSPLHWHSFIEVSGFVGAVAQKRFDAANEIKQVFTNALEATRQRLSVVPHAPYSISKKLFDLINNSSANKTISIHNQECAAEDELYLNKGGGFLELYSNFGIDIADFKPTGKRSLQSWLPTFTKQQKLIMVHNSFTTKDDVNFAANYTAVDTLYYCLCPNANLYIENTLPDVEMLVQENCNIVIGTDSYASNDQLNIYEEVKTICNNFSNIDLPTVLKWATINGAKALELDELIGSFETGKRPGVVVLGDVARRII